MLWRAPRPCGACPTQPYKCSQNVKINVKTAFVLVFNIPTALKGWVGLAAKRTGALQPLYGYRPYENIKKIKNIWHGA
jgi:hypothetical protein